jgi:phage shock protein PspC (stress-responsive transcriptional regulator)
MKKTFTINISGSVFHIEEDAFEKLQDYLQRLSQYFGSQTGGQEILQDIESRIAELLQDKTTETQEAVTIEWVEEITERMGKPEDFMETEQTESAGETTTELKCEKIRKRLYRDPENRVLGGVCSGMGTYFNIDPVFIRILFVLLVFLGAGISIIVYLVFWIVVPVARTTAQRLEMKGEEPTISNIQKTIQEEVKEVKDSFSKINQSESFKKGKEAASKAGQASVQVLKSFGRVLGIFLGGLLIFLGFIGLVIFLVSVAVGGSVFHGNSGMFQTDVNLPGLLGFFVSPGLVGVSILLIVLLIGIPLLATLFVGTKLVFRYKTNNKLIGMGAFGIWLVALIATIAITAGQFNNFMLENTATAGKPIDCLSCKTLYLKSGTLPTSMDIEKNIDMDDFLVATVNGKQVLAGRPHLKLEATDGSDFSVIIKRKARGKNNEAIQNSLKQIQYEVNSRDSTLVLDPFFRLENQARWRNQEVLVTVKVPKGKMVHLDNDLDQMQFDFENLNNLWNKEMTGKTWTMTPEGLALKE